MTDLEKKLRDALEDTIEIAYSNDDHGVIDLQDCGRRLLKYVDLINEVDSISIDGEQL